jgi:hypothetical protein
MAGAFGAGGLLMLHFATIFFNAAGRANFCVGVVFVLVAAMSATLALRSWRTRLTPLSIERSGRVAYGDRELCAPGSVQAVCVAPSRAGEAYTYEIAFETGEGQLVFVPSQYFPPFATRQDARSLATKFAEILHVKVTESN